MKLVLGSLVLLGIIGTFGWAGAAPAEPREQRVTIQVTGKGFEPATVKVKAGTPVRLIVTRKTDRTCATDLVIERYGIKKSLPLNRTVEVVLTPRKRGEIRYACAMNMIAGKLIAE